MDSDSASKENIPEMDEQTSNSEKNDMKSGTAGSGKLIFYKMVKIFLKKLKLFLDKLQTNLVQKLCTIQLQL